MDLINSSNLVSSTSDSVDNINETSQYMNNYYNYYNNPDPLEDVTSKMKVYVTPILVGLGVLGNSLSLVVFTATELRKQNASIYLAALAVSDTGYLICVFIVWLSWFNINMFHMMPWCPMTVYFTYVFGFLSVWIIVAFTVERFIVVCFPLRSRDFIRTRNTKIVVGFLVVFALVFYCFATWTSGIVPYGQIFTCAIYMTYVHFLAIVTYIDVAITFVIPCIAIVALNLAIICAMFKIHTRFQTSSQLEHNRRETIQLRVHSTKGSRYYHESVHSDADSSSPEHFCNSNRRKRDVHQKRQIKMTKFLLVISTSFLVLNLPSHALRLRLILLQVFQPGYQQSQREVAVQQLVEFIYYLNYAINFLLYSLCGNNFRKNLVLLFRRMCRRVKFVSQQSFRFSTTGSQMTAL